MSQRSTAITLKGVTKKFHRDGNRSQSALSLIKKILLGREDVQSNINVVLRDISLDIKKGEKVGLIGRNGSGKSTLLRLIASIYVQDSGDLVVDGKVAYISGFSQGMKPRLSGIDNIKIIGALYGIDHDVIMKLLPSIIEFTELEESIQDKVFTYSDGMKSRLAFSAGIHFIEHNNPDIILLDEVFSGGGDMGFQEKARQRVLDFISLNKTLVFAGHSLGTISEQSTRCLWLKNGKIFMDGDSKDVLEKYANQFGKSLVKDAAQIDEDAGIAM